MMNLTSTSDLIRVVTGSAAQIECHASWVDVLAGAGKLGRTNTPAITTATTTTIVAPPAASTERNVKYLNITNNHASQSCVVTVEHTDGTTVAELISVILLSGENLVFTESRSWIHHDINGAEYPPAGKGDYDGFSVPFMKTGTAADVAGAWYCSSKDAGFPGAWTPGSPGVNGRVTNGTTSADFGCIPIKNPSVGANYLTGLTLAASLQHTHMFFDCLWVNTGLVVTTTTAQTLTMPTLPARDINGSTNGEGLLIGMLFTSASSNAGAITNATVSYTNSAGIAGRTATLQAINGSQIPISPVIGTIIWFSLQAGDKGVRSIQSVTLGTSLVSGSIAMMIARPISWVGTPIISVASPNQIDAPGIRLYNGVCTLHCYVASSVTATFIAGELVIQEK